MRRTFALALLALVSSCGGGDGDSGSGGSGAPEVVEFPFEKPLGEQRPVAWSVSPVSGDGKCESLTFGDGILRFDLGSNEVIARGHQSATEPPLWKAPWPDMVCATLHPTPDGGAVVVARVGAMTHIVRFGGDGAVRWDSMITGTLTIPMASGLLSSGDVAIPLTEETGKHYLVIVGGADGKEKSRTFIDPGLGHVEINAVAAMPDGGVVIAGSNGGMVVRFDAAGKVSWSKTILGERDQPSFVAVAPLSDGSILATGTFPIDTLLTAVAIRFRGGDGRVLWSKSFPYRDTPAQTDTWFDAIVPRDDGGASVVLHAIGGCRLVRLDAAGDVKGVQLLDTFGGLPDTCSARALGRDIGYVVAVSAAVGAFAKVTP